MHLFCTHVHSVTGVTFSVKKYGIILLPYVVSKHILALFIDQLAPEAHIEKNLLAIWY